MSFLRGLDDVDATEHLITDGNNRCWDSFRDLMRREWFNCRWIVQEIALARNAKVYCGNEVITWYDFMFAVSLLIEKADVLLKMFHQSPELDFRHDHLGEVGVMSAKPLSMLWDLCSEEPSLDRSLSICCQARLSCQL
jgi:hypothetical protein